MDRGDEWVSDWQQRCQIYNLESTNRSVWSSNIEIYTNKKLIDTGTTNILLPPDIVVKYFSAVPKAQKKSDGFYTVPCDAATAALPNLIINFTPPEPVASFIQPSSSGGINTKPYRVVIPGKFFIGNPTGKKDDMCQAGINNVTPDQPWDIILGDVFLMTQLVIFDLADPNGSVDSRYPNHGQIGFAPKPTNITTS